MVKFEFFKDYGEANRYQIQDIVGKGSYGVVCSAIDKQTGEKVAIKKINDVFEHVSDATRILREIKLLRFLRHPDIVQIKHILLPPSPRDFKDIYVVFELMEADLHQVIKANDDLTPEHFQFFLYQLLRALKYMHSANVFHRDLKPKNILANGDCKLKICDFGLARVTFNDTSTAIFWTDYVATRWYRAPELCGSFYSRYTTAVDIWSIGCIFAELVTGKPLFPGKNVVHQLDVITDLLGTPSAEAISQIQNEKAKRYLSNMRKKSPIPFQRRFPNLDPLAVKLLQKLLAFDPRDRPTAEEALADAYFKGLAKVEREPTSKPASKEDFNFERKRLTEHDLREMIYQEILEYHPQIRQQTSNNNRNELLRFIYPSAIDQLKKQFDHLQTDPKEASVDRRHCSVPREHLTEVNENEKKHARDNNVTQCPQNKSIAPQQFSQSDSMKNRRTKDPVMPENDDSKLKKTMSFSEQTNSIQSQMATNAKLNRSLRVDHESCKNIWNEAKVHQPRSGSAMASITKLTDSKMNSKKDQDNDKKQEDVKVSLSRSRPMGATVAKLVAAFSNGMG